MAAAFLFSAFASTFGTTAVAAGLKLVLGEGVEKAEVDATRATKRIAMVWKVFMVDVDGVGVSKVILMFIIIIIIV